MPVQSDLTLNTSKFAPSSIPPEIAKLNEHIIKVMEENPKWYEVFLASSLWTVIA